MQEIVYQIQNEGKNSTKQPLSARYLFIESDFPRGGSDIEKWALTPPPHLIKTHCGPTFFQKTLAEKKTKFIVVLRNAKDMLVSFYNFYKMNEIFQFNGTWDEYFSLFKENKLVHGDYFELQLNWWKLRDNQEF